jgi:hypothetical protein
METITITRALAKLKLLDKQITKAVQNGTFSNYTVGGKSILEQFTPQEDLQTVQDLITFRAKLKTGIMKSNSLTQVKIGDKSMTVVEAIETKDSIKYRESLLRKMKSDVAEVEENVEYGNNQVQERLDKMLVSSFGRDSKPKAEDIKSISEPFIASNGFKSVDNVKIQETIEKMESDIDIFVSEVDMILSESNAVTKIEV